MGAVAGRADILDLSSPERGQRVTHAGTFNGNPMMAVAGRATMEALTPEAFDAARRRSARTRAAASRRPRADCRCRSPAPARCSRSRRQRERLRDYRDAATADKRWEALCSLALLNEGFVLTPTMSGCVSTVTTRDEVDALRRRASRSDRDTR